MPQYLHCTEKIKLQNYFSVSMQILGHPRHSKLAFVPFIESISSFIHRRVHFLLRFFRFSLFFCDPWKFHGYAEQISVQV